MGKRHTGRKIAMQVLYQVDLRKKDLNEVALAYFENLKVLDETKVFALKLTEQTWQNRDKIDGMITDYATGWDLNRISLVDKAILRLAFFELLDRETSHRIVIDEALELAKHYSTESSSRFINGILGNYVKDQCLQD
ncbi:MAG: transcription antitermination factor NusB [Actinobacteria bacterium]|nr:transcription antitermination factor NusB [Actinomycetota bacterium]|tara:strand:- start:254 stop:664 length:411 start_codon:yes stop_codon:yes gene_type:complete